MMVACNGFRRGSIPLAGTLTNQMCWGRKRMEVNMTVENRATSNMRRLVKGDKFVWNREVWIVTGMVERQGDSEVRVPMRRVDGQRSRRHTFQGDRRVTLV